MASAVPSVGLRATPFFIPSDTFSSSITRYVRGSNREGVELEEER